MKTALLWCLLIAPLLALPGCGGGGGGAGRDTSPPGARSDTGTVRYISLEGGFYGIVGDNGQKYEAINLAAKHRVDGQRVRFDYVPLIDVMSIHMWGQIIEITRIETLPGD
jgi:hypothetical protein